MSIKKAVKKEYVVLKPVRLENITHKKGDAVQMLPKQAVFLVSSGVLEEKQAKKAVKS